MGGRNEPRRKVLGSFHGNGVGVSLGLGGCRDRETSRQPVNLHAIALFFCFVLFTLGITVWAAKRSRSASDFYSAGGGISSMQNGLALAGDYMSASTLLGITAIIYTDGIDGYIYLIAFFTGWPVLLLLMTDRLRNLGKFTFADVTSYRLAQRPIRAMSALGSLVVVCFYLIAQMVGAGQLIKLLFGLEYNWALIIVGFLMMAYVIFGDGGHHVGADHQGVSVVDRWHDRGLARVLEIRLRFRDAGFKAMEIHRSGAALLMPGKLLGDPVAAISLSLGLIFGTAGMPHILMRFFTVKDAKEARNPCCTPVASSDISSMCC